MNALRMTDRQVETRRRHLVLATVFVQGISRKQTATIFGVSHHMVGDAVKALRSEALQNGFNASQRFDLAEYLRLCWIIFDRTMYVRRNREAVLRKMQRNE